MRSHLGTFTLLKETTLDQGCSITGLDNQDGCLIIIIIASNIKKYNSSYKNFTKENREYAENP